MKINSVRSCAIIMAAVMAVSCAMTGCSSKNSGNSGAPADSDSSTSAVNSDTLSGGTSDIFVNNDFTYGQVAMGGGGFITGIVNTCEPGLFYARTDVGGAYRWDKDSKAWICLNADITDDDRGLLGIDGIAVDPKNAARVYLAAGTEYFSNAKTCIMVSDDYGEHFRQVDVSDLIRVHGNGMGRGNGERIAVDPNNSDIIYCGGRRGGMIRSTDGGNTWEKVESFPVDTTKNAVGINIIAFDGSKSADGKTTRIYAGISETKQDNLFYSDDAGASWKPFGNVPENALKLMPERLDLDSKGRVYISYGNREGPWNSTKGNLIRYDFENGTADEISPVSCTVGDIAIDPANDDRIVLVTSEMWMEQPNGAYGDQFYRTTDGGKNWEQISDYTMSTNGMDWISNAAIHWCSVLAMDSANGDTVLVNSGNGIFACDNIWDANPEWYFDSNGIEETVPEDIISYKDYPLVSAIGDYDGFVHEDIFTSAPRHTKQIGSCTSITVAAQNHDLWAKVGGDEKNMLLCYSTDGGKTWNDITNCPDESKTLYRGKLALTADGSALIWSASNGKFAYRTENWGETWEKVEGIIGSGDVYLIGDPENSNYVYGCAKSIVYVSSDGGKSFSRKFDTGSNYKRLAIAPGNEGLFYIPGGGCGLLVSKDHGENIELVPGLKFCDAVGLGAPKNESDPYVIYVSGMLKEGNTKGIYMSEDEGQTWSRVNDDLHNYGGIGNGEFVAGDMNVYGRCYMSTVGMGIVYFDKKD